MTSSLAEVARLAAETGAARLAVLFRAGDLEVRRKGPNDFVTRADHEAEAAIVGVLREAYPDHAVLTEESGLLPGGDDQHQWIIDPLDGTTNFLQGLPVWCVSVACRRGSELVAAAVVDQQGGNVFVAEAGAGAFWNARRMSVSTSPSLRGAFLATGYPFRAHPALDCYLAAFRSVFLEARAIRRCGAAALDLAYTAAGVYDGFFEFRLSPWDVAAGGLLIREAGGLVSDLDGGEGWLLRGNLVAGNPRVQPELLALVAAHASESLLDRLVPP